MTTLYPPSDWFSAGEEPGLFTGYIGTDAKNFARSNRKRYFIQRFQNAVAGRKLDTQITQFKDI